MTAEVVRFLEESGVLGAGAVRRVDTHAAHVFLAGDRAWKLKRPVKLGYLDFSTPERREAALAAELRLNRRTAPGLYLGLRAITREPDGGLALDGEGVAVDWLLEMRRFADDALLAQRAAQGPLDVPLLLRLADDIHAFHAAAEVASASHGAERLARVIDGNGDSLAAVSPILDGEAAAALLARQREVLARHAVLLDARSRAGRVRHCHGDLHLANVALVDDAFVPFDCLEFDVELATTDVLYDLAFLLMDLWYRERRTEANLLFNRYLDLSGEDEEGAALLPLFLSVRATVRAHIAATRAMTSDNDADRVEARGLLAFAAAVLDPVAPLLLAIGGRSGTGKSTLARALAGDIGGAPGARVLRSDVLRKRMAGLAPEQTIAAAEYTPAAAARVYDVLDGLCRAHLENGVSVIADAAFLDAAERDAIARAARSAGARFMGLWLEAGVDARVSRVAARRGDASDADARVVRLQTNKPVGPLEGWRRIMTGKAPADVAAAARRVLCPTR